MLGIVVLALWIGCFMLPYLGYVHQRNLCRKGFTESLSTRSLTDLAILEIPTAEKIHWMKPGREFMRDGALYDVVAMEYQNEKIVITCKRDSREEAVVLIWKNQSERQHGIQPTYKVEKPVYVFEQHRPALSDEFQFISIPDHSNLRQNACYTRIIVQPPEAVV